MDPRERKAIMSEGAIRAADPRDRAEAEALAAELEDNPFASRAVRRRLRNFHAVNELVGRHNVNFPAESRLPMDPRTGDFVLLNGRRYQREPLDARWILDRFPPERGRALDHERENKTAA